MFESSDDPVTALDAVAARLRAAGCVAAEDEARELVVAADGDPDTLEAWVWRREQGEPLPWITGTTTFCGLSLHVAPDVYVPRAQSEDLARRAAAVLPRHGRAVDLCTGAGAIAAYLHASVPTATVIGIDLDPRAATCARSNGVPAIVGDLDAPLRAPHGRRFDVVTAVAPYVPSGSIQFLPVDVQRYEPLVALDGGDDGLALVRRVVAAAARLLRPGGWMMAELGGDQDVLVGPALATHGFDHVDPWHDDDGDLRGVAARLVSPSPGTRR